MLTTLLNVLFLKLVHNRIIFLIYLHLYFNLLINFSVLHLPFSKSYF